MKVKCLLHMLGLLKSSARFPQGLLQKSAVVRRAPSTGLPGALEVITSFTKIFSEGPGHAIPFFVGEDACVRVRSLRAPLTCRIMWGFLLLFSGRGITVRRQSCIGIYNFLSGVCVMKLVFPKLFLAAALLSVFFIWRSLRLSERLLGGL